MSPFLWVAAIVAVLLLVYLSVVMLKPEIVS